MVWERMSLSGGLLLSVVPEEIVITLISAGLSQMCCCMAIGWFGTAFRP